MGGVLLPPRSGRNGRVEVLTSGERVHQSWVRVGGVSRLLFGLANLRVTFSKFQSDRLRHVGIKPYALLQNRPQKMVVVIKCCLFKSAMRLITIFLQSMLAKVCQSNSHKQKTVIEQLVHIHLEHHRMKCFP